MRKYPIPFPPILPFQWKKAWTEYIVFVIALRFMYAFIGLWILSSGGPVSLQETVYGLVKPYLKTDLFSLHFVNPWFQWDTISYLKIAILGYERDATVAFMPLYPMLVRYLGVILGGNYLLAALIISTLCTFVVVILLDTLCCDLYTEEVGRRTVILFLAFPTTFFLLAGYSEALFLMLVLSFWLFARKKNWLMAGMCAGLATLTRLQGIILSIVMLWMIAANIWEMEHHVFTGFRQDLRNVVYRLWEKMTHPVSDTRLAVFIPIVLAVGYQAWLSSARLGTTSGALQKYWRMDTVTPWSGLILFLQRIPTNHYKYMDWIDLVLLLVVVIAAMIGLRRLDPVFSLYVWLTLAVLWMRGNPPHLLASYSRYFLALFPLFLLPALLKSNSQRLAIVIVFFAFQVLLVTVFLWGSWVA